MHEKYYLLVWYTLIIITITITLIIIIIIINLIPFSEIKNTTALYDYS